MTKCIESWSSRFSQVYALPPYLIPAIPAPLWIYLTYILPKGFSRSPISSKRPVKVCWASCLLMPAAIWEAWHRPPWASSRRLRQVQIPTRRRRRPKHHLQTSLCGLAARILKLRKSSQISIHAFCLSSSNAASSRQTRRHNRRPSYWSYVLGFHHRLEEKSSAELCAAPE